MSPTSSSRLFAGRNARSATLRTISGAPLDDRTRQDYGRRRGSVGERAASCQSLRCHLALPARMTPPRDTAATSPRRRRALGACAALGAALAALAGCGDGAREDAGTASGGPYPSPSSARRSRRASTSASAARSTLAVRNAGDDTIPDLVVTLRGLRDRTAGARRLARRRAARRRHRERRHLGRGRARAGRDRDAALGRDADRRRHARAALRDRAGAGRTRPRDAARRRPRARGPGRRASATARPRRASIRAAARCDARSRGRRIG